MCVGADFPPDFDPTKIPRQPKEQQERLKEKFVVRMMLPMSVRCQNCGEYMYKGKKFNSRKESVEGPEGQYLGIQIFRFYFKCVTCSAEFTIKTDPQNMDYAVEGGARANYELYKAEQKEKDAMAAEREEGEKYDAMKKLENKTEESKRAMDILDALDEIRTNNARAAKLGLDDVLASRQRALEREEAATTGRLEQEDELEVQRAFTLARNKRIRDEDEEDDGASDAVRDASGSGGVGDSSSGGSGPSAMTHGRDGTQSRAPAAAASAASSSLLSAKAASKRPKLPAFSVVVQPKVAAAAAAPPASPVPPATSPSAPPSATAGGSSGVLLGLGAYDSSSGSGSGGEDGEQ